MRVAKATTKDGRAVGDVPRKGQPVWALTKDGEAIGGLFSQGEVFRGFVFEACVELMHGDCGSVKWADIVTWAAAPKLTTKDNGDLIMADLPF